MIINDEQSSYKKTFTNKSQLDGSLISTNTYAKIKKRKIIILGKMGAGKVNFLKY
jgi:predicted NACHT family NTPase